MSFIPANLRPVQTEQLLVRFTTIEVVLLNYFEI